MVEVLFAVNPRVLFVGAFPRAGVKVIGGMVTSCQALLASSLPSRLRLDLLDTTQISNPPPVLPVRLMLAIVRFGRFVRRFETNRPQAVILFAALGASVVEKGVMAYYARMRGIPAVIFPRAGSIVDDCRRSAFTRAWARLFFRAARKIVCQSAAWRNFAIQTLGFAPEDVVVIRNWTADREILAIGQQRRPSATPPVRLVFVGWLERNKGVIELIQACRDLVARGDFILQIIGDGAAAGEARELVERFGMTDVIEFRGWLQAAELRRALQDANVFVLPSWAEGLPNAMIEAMAARVAVVVSAVGAIPEIIDDHRSGLLVPPRDVPALAAALAEIIADDALRNRLADEAYTIAKREFAPESAVDQIVAIIDSVVAPRAHFPGEPGVHG
jgi:glycosyltransferase involved in cell wall biosynthesis